MGATVVRGPSHTDFHGHAWCITVADVGVQGLWRVWRGAALARMHQETTPQAICCSLRSESLVRLGFRSFYKSRRQKNESGPSRAESVSWGCVRPQGSLTARRSAPWISLFP